MIPLASQHIAMVIYCLGSIGMSGVIRPNVDRPILLASPSEPRECNSLASRLCPLHEARPGADHFGDATVATTHCCSTGRHFWRRIRNCSPACRHIRCRCASCAVCLPNRPCDEWRSSTSRKMCCVAITKYDVTTMRCI